MTAHAQFTDATIAPALPERPPLGKLLCLHRAARREDVEAALDRQSHDGRRLGELLLEREAVTPAGLTAALADQWGVPAADLSATPPDVQLIDRMGADWCLRHRCLPWRSVGGAVLVASSDPARFETARAALSERLGPVYMAAALETEIEASIADLRARRLATFAEERVDPAESCRAGSRRRALVRLAAIAAALGSAVAVAPREVFIGFCLLAILALLLTSALKLAATLAQLGHLAFRSRRPPPPLDPAPLPVVTILVPLFKEREIAGQLLARLDRIAYPREMLDICLVVEEDDRLTRDTLSVLPRARSLRQIVVPPGRLKTKPRALNYALDFARGEIVGVWDAEDMPDPDQVHRVVRRFRELPDDVACLQGTLEFYNPRANWLARCFALEYAVWFRLILPGMSRLGLAVPLGGTTLFFRRAALERLGGWDAHNVTEDADLGIRLARRGYRTALLPTVTQEEANCRLLPWIRQRARWLKGYAMTYGVHMRRPLALWRDLGTWKFLGMQLLFLGTLAQFVLAPLLWSFWAVPLGLGHPLIDMAGPGAFWALVFTFAGAELLTLFVNVAGALVARKAWLIPWAPTLHLYYPLGAIAAYAGLWDLMRRPFYWDKTAHGVPRAVRRRCLLRRA